jgi:hypothetical protein
MKKIALVLAALSSVVAASGCLSNAAQACIKFAECAEEEDPAAACEKADADETELCNDTDFCPEVKEGCAAEKDAFSACTVANGKCEDGFFGANVADDCEAEIKALNDCATAIVEAG